MRILIAWELGANFGHLARQLPVAKRLRELGHEVTFAVRDPKVAEMVLTPHGFKYVAAPRLVGRGRSQRPPANYAELLLIEGYFDVPLLVGHVRGWVNLLQLTQADALIADHAPTAMIAARVLGMPTLALGNGFEIPPNTVPLPSFRPWNKVDPNVLARSERIACDKINSCLKQLNCANGLDRITNLFNEGAALIATFRELDHYAVREEGAIYVGQLNGAFAGRRESWRTDRKKIVAYLRNPSRAIRSVMSALQSVDAEVICVIPGIDTRRISALSSNTFRVHAHAVELSDVLPHADALVCHGGVGTVSQALLAGVPSLLLPTTVEQYLQSNRVEELGAGINFDHARDPKEFVGSLQNILADAGFIANAKKFSERHSPFDHVRAVETVVDTVTAMVSRTGGKLH